MGNPQIDNYGEDTIWVDGKQYLSLNSFSKKLNLSIMSLSHRLRRMTTSGKTMKRINSFLKMHCSRKE